MREGSGVGVGLYTTGAGTTVGVGLKVGAGLGAGTGVCVGAGAGVPGSCEHPINPVSAINPMPNQAGYIQRNLIKPSANVRRRAKRLSLAISAQKSVVLKMFLPSPSNPYSISPSDYQGLQCLKRRRCGKVRLSLLARSPLIPHTYWESQKFHACMSPFSLPQPTRFLSIRLNHSHYRALTANS